MRHALVILAVVCALVALPEGAPQTSGTASPASSTIEIDTVFVDKNGAPVTNIRRDEVEVWIAGYRVPLDTFIAVTPEDAVRSRRAIVLLLDDITLDPALAPRVREAGRQMVQRLAPGDEMAVIALSGDAARSTNDPQTLLRVLDEFNTRATGTWRADMLGGQVLATVASVSRQMSESAARRRTIVGIGSGWLFDTPLPPPTAGRELRPEWMQAMYAMASANVTLYVIDPGGVGRSRFPGGDGGFAREAGGFAFMNTNNVKAAADQIMAEAASYYILGVGNPPKFQKAPLREVEVRVKRPGVTARARRAIAGPTPPG